MGCAGSRPAPLPPLPPPVQGVNPAAPGLPPRVKLVLLGDSGVGKSCLVQRYVRGAFDPGSKVTVGAAFMSHSLTLPDGKNVKFEIWDTAGQERYASLAPLYYRGASAAIVVYDMTSSDTFAKAKHWITELRKNASGSIVMILVGNKSDLLEHRAVSEEEGRELAERNGMLFVETSAKTAANCALVFESVAKNISGYVEPPTNESAGAPPTKHPEPGEDPDTATPISTPPTFTPPTSTTPGPGSK